MNVRVFPVASGFAVNASAMTGDEFQAYIGCLRALRGKYDPTIKSHCFRMETLHSVIDNLKQNGFEPSVDPTINAKIQETNTVTLSKHEQARARLDRQVAELAKRGIKLLDFQPEGIIALATHDAYGNFDDMGLGKTCQGLLALEDEARAVWICPASVKLQVASEAVDKFRPDLKPVILDGRGSFRWPAKGELVITNYDILPGEIKRNARGKKAGATGIEAPPPGVTLIADECHALKGGQATRTVRFRAMSKLVRATFGKVWLLTGTEMLHRPMDLWNVLCAAGLELIAWPGGFPEFMADFHARRGTFGIQWPDLKDPNAQIDAPAIVRKLRRVSIKRMKADVMKDLPPKRYETITVPIDDKTRLMLDEVVKHLAEKGVNVDDVHDLVQVTKLKSAGFEEMSAAMKALALAKMPAVLEIIEQFEEQDVPLILFSAHRDPVEMAGKREGWVTILGGESNAKRHEAKNEFQAGGLKGIAGTIGAMGVGHTLTHSSTVLRVDRDWSPELNRQAEDRSQRYGQKGEFVRIIDIVADHALDKRLTAILVEKSETIGRTTHAAAIKVGEYAPEMMPTVPVVAFTPEVVAPAPPPAPKPRRGPRTPQEVHAKNALIQLAALDPDRAAEQNGVGFNAYDGEFGHKLALRVQASGLTDAEWSAAEKLISKYRRQVGSVGLVV